ncbi:MAG: hypothetical protein SPL51_04845 [Lachnospiraceae bacterium]|nr:hypothetical protein [Lachnospiraceae bacterium]
MNFIDLIRLIGDAFFSSLIICLLPFVIILIGKIFLDDIKDKF